MSDEQLAELEHLRVENLRLQAYVDHMRDQVRWNRDQRKRLVKILIKHDIAIDDELTAMDADVDSLTKAIWSIRGILE